MAEKFLDTYDGQTTAELLAMASAASEDYDARSAVFAACDERYFANEEPIADRLFAWMGAHQSAIKLEK